LDDRERNVYAGERVAILVHYRCFERLRQGLTGGGSLIRTHVGHNPRRLPSGGAGAKLDLTRRPKSGCDDAVVSLPRRTSEGQKRLSGAGSIRNRLDRSDWRPR
jgi:hypothetical protein